MDDLASTEFPWTSVVKRVTAATIRARYYQWDWGEAIAMDGLWAIGSVQKDSGAQEFVRRAIERWIAYRPDPWYPEHLGPGRALLEVWQASGDPGLLAYARLLAAHLLKLPRGPSGCFYSRPDLPDRARMVWVDSLYTDPGFLCLLGRLTGELDYCDAAVERLEAHMDLLQDETGLVNHAYDDVRGDSNHVHWARGNGWAALGLVWCLQSLPTDHSGYVRIAERFRRLIDAVVRCSSKEASGWSTVLDDPDTYIEASASLMLCCAVLGGVRLGILPQITADFGLRVWQMLAAHVDERGIVDGVSGRTPPREDSDSYNRVPIGAYVWGQGAYLLAATEMARRFPKLHENRA